MGPDAESLRRRLLEKEPAADPERLRIVRAPGRVNLMGDHTDYNDGLVLPAAIDLELAICSAPSDDREVHLTVDESGEVGTFDLDHVGPPTGTWLDYVAGVAREMSEAGIGMRGLRGVIGSSLPIGAGLSSSAALELASAWTLASSLPPADGLSLARLAQRAENRYVGVQCGLMDQMAVSFGETDAALLIDCRTLAWRPVSLPLTDHALVAIDTGSQRRLNASEYNARRAECQDVVTAIAAADPSIRSLRDVTLATLRDASGRVEPTALRRGEHVVRENARVLATVEALETGDLSALRELFAASHASLRDLFEVSSPELDAVVEIGRGVPGVSAIRMTGAGFGGCAVAIVARHAVDALRGTLAKDYQDRTGFIATVHVVRPTAGVGLIGA